MYRQYLHTGSNPQTPNWLTSGESILLPSSSLWPPSTDSQVLSQFSRPSPQPQCTIHRSTIDSWALSHFSSPPPLWGLSPMTRRCWVSPPSPWKLANQFLPLLLWTCSASVSLAFSTACRDWLTLPESEYCPTSLPTVAPKGPYKSASPSPN